MINEFVSNNHIPHQGNVNTGASLKQYIYMMMIIYNY
jgi:hypothetical protein